MYHLYEYDGKIGVKGCAELPDGYSVEKFKPDLRRLLRKQVSATEYIWKMISWNRCTVYEVLDRQGNEVHRSLHTGKNFKFRFLKKNTDYEIGPCMTVELERGKGIYPFVLKSILADFPDSRHFMLIRDSNESSIRGVRKAGFQRTVLVSRKHFGVWSINKE